MFWFGVALVEEMCGESLSRCEFGVLVCYSRSAVVGLGFGLIAVLWNSVVGEHLDRDVVFLTVILTDCSLTHRDDRVHGGQGW